MKYNCNLSILLKDWWVLFSEVGHIGGPETTEYYSPPFIVIRNLPDWKVKVPKKIENSLQLEKKSLN